MPPDNIPANFWMRPDILIRSMMGKTKAENLDVDARFLLANERTLLAWIRTSLAVMAAGVAVAFLSNDSLFLTLSGVGAIILGGILSVVGYIRYVEADRAIRGGELPAPGRGEIFVVVTVASFAVIVMAAKLLSL